MPSCPTAYQPPTPHGHAALQYLWTSRHDYRPDARHHRRRRPPRATGELSPAGRENSRGLLGNHEEHRAWLFLGSASGSGCPVVPVLPCSLVRSAPRGVFTAWRVPVRSPRRALSTLAPYWTRNALRRYRLVRAETFRSSIEPVRQTVHWCTARSDICTDHTGSCR